MKERSVRIIATYLSKRPRGRIVRLRPVGYDDYIIAIETPGQTAATRL